MESDYTLNKWTSILPNVLKAYLNVTQDDKSNAFAVAISHLAVNLLTIEFTLLMMLALHYSAGTLAISHVSAWVWSSHWPDPVTKIMPLIAYLHLCIFLLLSCKQMKMFCSVFRTIYFFNGVFTKIFYTHHTFCGVYWGCLALVHITCMFTSTAVCVATPLYPRDGAVYPRDNAE